MQHFFINYYDAVLFMAVVTEEWQSYFVLFLTKEQGRREKDKAFF